MQTLLKKICEATSNIIGFALKALSVNVYFFQTFSQIYKTI